MSITLKDDEAIKKLRKGGKIHAAIMAELAAMVRVGNTTLDIDDRAMELSAEHGVEPLLLGYVPQFGPRPYPAATCVSINDILVHGIPNETPRTIEEGDIVSIDFVLGYEGVVLDGATTIGAGTIDPEDKVLLEVTQAALKAGIHAAQPGNYVRDIGRAIEAVVPEEYGIVEALSGHGVGYEVHEEPMVPNFVMKGDSPQLEAGMVLAIEPMIIAGDKDVIFDQKDGYTVYTADGGNGAHFEHTVLITPKGPEILTIK
ncbi:type I methionyl aminopeptidase [Candidatus Pacebacteria bacterium]|nr:type I methionyl aminopeptidase [Candidatus Paceibacterota bacterium]